MIFASRQLRSATSAHPTRITAARRPTGRLTSLDGLRALAVLLVFASHVDQGRIVGGFTGVELFFVLSGYLITYLLLKEQQVNGGVTLRWFYARRALRLWPALIAMLLITTPIAFVDHIGRPPLDSIFSLVYLSDLWPSVQGGVALTLHTWSLSVEEQFYLIWPVALLLMLRRGRSPLPVLLVSFILSIALGAACFHVHRIFSPQYLPWNFVPALGGGALLALLLERPPSARLTQLAKLGPVALLGAVAATVLVSETWWTIPLVAAISWLVVLHLVVDPDSAICRAFRLRPAVWLGERSYGFYLWHYPILLLLGRSLGTLDRALLGLPLTLLVTAASWRFVEEPFLRIKRRFEPTREERAAADVPLTRAPGVELSA